MRSLLPAVLMSSAALAQQPENPQSSFRPQPPTISTSASADAKYAPDRATVSIAVQTQAPTASVASAENARRQMAVLNSLRALGLTNEELSTTGYTVSPEYKYSQNNSPTLVGYTVTNTVVANVHDLKQIGKVLDSAVGSGSNSISSLEFYAANTDVPRQQSISAAVAKARADAESAARAAGGTLGPLLRLNIGGASPPPPQPMYLAKTAMAERAPTPINPGQQTITTTISADWIFLPNR